MKGSDSGDRLPLCKWKMKVVDVEVQNIELMRLPKDELELTNVVRQRINNWRLDSAATLIPKLGPAAHASQNLRWRKA